MAYTVQQYKIFWVREPDHKATKEKRIISHRNDAVDFCKKFLFDTPIEKVVILALGNRNQIIGFTANEGTVNQSAVYPREIISYLLSAGATSFIIAHNHPGGGTKPSEADWTITRRLQKVGNLLELPLLDHLIVTDETVISLKDEIRWSEK